MELNAELAAEALYAWLGRNQDLWMVGEYSGEAFQYEDAPRSCLQDICSGKVVDGGTIYVLDADQELHKIRLAGIDAPELAQPYGKAAQENLWGKRPAVTVFSEPM